MVLCERQKYFLKTFHLTLKVLKLWYLNLQMGYCCGWFYVWIFTWQDEWKILRKKIFNSICKRVGEMWFGVDCYKKTPT